MIEFSITTRSGEHVRIKAFRATVEDGFVVLTTEAGNLVAMFNRPDKVIPQP
jgi:hypothetical protein